MIHPLYEGKPLTERELQVVQCLSEGKCNKTIARDLGITGHTVKLHLQNAYMKLGVTSRLQAVLVFQERRQTLNLKEKPE